MYMLIQDTQNDLYIDNDHKIRPRRLTLNNVWIIDSINLFHLLVNSINFNIHKNIHIFFLSFDMLLHHRSYFLAKNGTRDYYQESTMRI